MKIAGIILIIIQIGSFITTAIQGGSIFGNGFANLLGRCIFGIVGIILLVVAAKKKSKK